MEQASSAENRSAMDAKLGNARVQTLTVEQLKTMTDNFSEDRKIGSGGYGDVYLGVQEDGERIAVKLFHYLGGIIDDEFDNGLRNHMKLEHQNILRIVAYCYEMRKTYVELNGEFVFATRIWRAHCTTYARNGSLGKHLSDERHGFDWPTRYRIIKGICEGVKYLHYHARIIHGDIKPNNILLDENMEPMLTDFETSTLFSNYQEYKKCNIPRGTVGYMAPEYIHIGLVSMKLDIFSLGVVMIRIIAGHEARSQMYEMSTEDFIDRVHANWRSRLQLTFRGSTLDAYCRQVERCTQIALGCVEMNYHKRPDTVEIARALNETETYKGFEVIQIWKIPFDKLKNSTDNFTTEIGKGAFGAVYKGKLDGELVAVKKLNHHSANQRKQIDSENHLKNLEHENIVRLIGFCHETISVPVPDPKNPDKHILVDVTESLLCYEFLSNGSLEDKMWRDESSKLDWQTRYSVIQGICKGLHYLHQGCQNAPIVHRDLKPGNVLLNHDMVPKLADFGLSRIVPKTRSHITMAVGSSGYMAPETLQDSKFSKITPKSDIYSLGVLILEIVTGDKCPDHEYSGRQYIEKVREAQKQKSYIASRYPSLDDRFHQQVESWIRVGLRCAEELPERRPPMQHIMHFLETEYANSADIHQEGIVSKISFKELEDITNKFSAQYGEIIFGAVYEGTRVNGDDMLVIKLKEHKELSPGQFTSEANRMSFKHKNVLQLKGYCEEIHAGEVRERLLCYEFFRNRSLDGIIYGDGSLTLRLDWEARYKIIKGICQALKYLHEECEYGPQAHMGITPANIWIDDEMVPKLGACGLSRLFGADYKQIYNKEIVESRGYVAPEHVELTKMSTKSDIYSLGVLVIEIVTGQKCPSGDNGSAASFIANVHKKWMKDDLQVKSKYPSLDADCLQQVKGCIKVGMQCAETNPDKRPTAGEIFPMLEKECTIKPGFWNGLCSAICTKA